MQERLRELSAQGDPLEKLAAAAGRRERSKAGRPAFDAVPDANTLWDFREALFARLDAAITAAGYLPRWPARSLM